MENLEIGEYIESVNEINNNIEFIKNHSFCRKCFKIIERDRKFFCKKCKDDIFIEKNKIIKCSVCNVIFINHNKKIHENSKFHKKSMLPK